MFLRKKKIKKKKKYDPEAQISNENFVIAVIHELSINSVKLC